MSKEKVNKEELKVLKEFYEINPDAPYYPTGVTLIDEVVGGGLGLGMAGGKFVNLTGDTSSGKCIRDAYVMTDNGIQFINDMGEKFPHGYTPHKEVLALDNKQSVEADYFYKESVPQTIKVNTKNFYNLEGTPNHPIGIWTSAGIVMKKLSEVVEGDIVVNVGGTEMYGPYQKTPVQIDEKSFNLPEVVTEEFAKVLGYFVADGNFSKDKIILSSTRDWVHEFSAKYFKSIGLAVTERESTVVTNSREFVSVFQEMFDSPEQFTARYKFVPRSILQSPKSVQASFLRALIDCDGSVDARDRKIHSIEYSTASERLMTEVRLMLLNMGIPVSVYPKDGATAGDKIYDHTYYRVVIGPAALRTYREVIGSDKYDFTMGLGGEKGDTTNRIPLLVDMITETINHIRKEVGWKKNGTCDVGMMPSWRLIAARDTYYTLTGFVEAYRPFAKYFPESHSFEFFEDLLEKHYCFNEVTSVEVKDETVDVYDFHVPEGHLFWANGIINHNTFLAWHIIAANHYYWASKGVTFRWMYDDAEHGSTMDVDILYGLEDYEDHIVHSKSVENYHSNMNIFLNSLGPDERGIYILDSLDPLKTEGEIEAVQGDLDKMEAGKDAKRGSFAMAKQKYLSDRFFPQMTPLLGKTNAIGIVISQVRYNVSGMGAQFTVSGGKAAEHNYNSRLMVSKQRPISITSEGESLDIGIGMKVKLMKNKCPRPNRECQLDVYFTQGVDDVGACVDYLYQLKTATGMVSKTKAIEWDEEKFKNREALIDYIYEKKLVGELRKRTIDKWERLEDVAKSRAQSRLPGQQWTWGKE